MGDGEQVKLDFTWTTIAKPTPTNTATEEKLSFSKPIELSESRTWEEPTSAHDRKEFTFSRPLDLSQDTSVDMANTEDQVDLEAVSEESKEVEKESSSVEEFVNKFSDESAKATTVNVLNENKIEETKSVILENLESSKAKSIPNKSSVDNVEVKAGDFNAEGVTDKNIERNLASSEEEITSDKPDESPADLKLTDNHPSDNVIMHENVNIESGVGAILDSTVENIISVEKT